MEMVINENRKWVLSVWEKIEKKIAVTSERIQDGMPYTSKDGKYIDRQDDASWWTNSFWCGILWILYRETKMEKYRLYAESIEKKLDTVLHGFDGLHHDVGFMWLLSSVMNYQLTGNDTSRKRALLAASTLSARANIAGGFIRAWNSEGIPNNGWAIIDCMMNIPLLYWASEMTNDARFRHIGVMHAEKTQKEFVREDGSVNHIVILDENTGEVLENPAGQGFASGSSWSRGQAWAVYGFAQSYHWTKEIKYLHTAKRIAHYILSNVTLNQYIPLCDYRQPQDSSLLDSSAGAITASGLIEIAKAVDESEKTMYLQHAVNLLRALDEKCAIWDLSDEAILANGTSQFNLTDGKYEVKNGALIYGDYYFIEAIAKLKDFTGKAS